MKTKITTLLLLLISTTFIYATNIKICPVVFANLQATQNVSFIDLTWQTSSEINNDYFTIERSTDSITFIQIGIINGSGNSGSTLNYTYTDSTANVNQNYHYRVKQVDFDAQFSYSMTTSYSSTTGFYQFEKNALLDVKIFPNPTFNNVNISWNSENKEIDFVLFDLTGKKIMHETIINSNEITIDTSNLPSATYIYKLQSSNKVLFTGKLIKE